MCDTLVALPESTKNGNLIFAKNSDREPDEAQAIIKIPRMSWGQGKAVQCTFISIPQVEETFEVILSKPFHMWGAEMGINEFGLVIGNEAVFTNVKIPKNNDGLTGMDMLRLALERCRTAPESVKTITELLLEYGQDACGGFKNKDFFYHNSFIIADPYEAYILETAGKSWAVKKVKNFATISNGLSINTDYTHLNIQDEKRSFPFSLLPKSNPFSFSQYFSDFLYTKVGRASQRRECSGSLLEAAKGKLTVEMAIQILQTHNLPDPQFQSKKATTASLCMHATGLTNPSQTTGSMVTEVRRNSLSTVWLTGTSMPCLSVFIPFFFGTDILKDFPQPGPESDSSLWWEAEKVHQWICKDYQKRKAEFWPLAKQLQNEFLSEEKRLIAANSDQESLGQFSKECLQNVKKLYRDFTSEFLRE
ncbi:carcinine hydrolase/isopenicillin-N N-acyltransferase family protein [Aquiflexum lacus]|uniref:carcinine hydrolase/isopenicillin-N N-acyltransferase family protein n=1 Tax=Aquiflexum lacus TaxID=2483805 RepID=UPI001894A06F|nr:carcinine hydrolase/isopenicillin-N N-acyltransferase family protein [Aquiflexum lacus]